ncbi:hypothetical protein TM233_61810 [Bradyrhizobium sp. TM233]|nr:hypothetical protein TM233_61810 [Bradyrhizobium sp. TM233]
MPRRRREAPAAGAGHQPADLQPGFRLRAAFHPAGQESASQSGLESRRGPALPNLGVRAAASAFHREQALPSERARHQEPAILQPEACRDVRRAAVRRGGQRVVRRACCPEPALRSAQVLSLARVSQSGQARRSEQALPAVPSALRAPEKASPWAPGRGGPEALLQAAALVASGPDVLREAAASARAAEPRQEAVPAAWEPGVPLAAEAEVSGRAAAAPRPEAAKAASVRQGAGVAAGGPDGPQVAAEAVAARRDAAVRLPAAAQRAGGAVQRRAAERPGARAQQAAQPRDPSAAASVFRQGPCLEAAPARPRAAAHFALAMRSLRIASRSEPSSRAARNEDWSWW